jgi:plastocyanin
MVGLERERRTAWLRASLEQIRERRQHFGDGIATGCSSSSRVERAAPIPTRRRRPQERLPNRAEYERAGPLPRADGRTSSSSDRAFVGPDRCLDQRAEARFEHVVGRLLFILVLLFASPAVASALAARSAGTVTVQVTAGKPSEGSFEFSTSAVPVGSVVFKIVNRGRRAHAFAIAGKRTAPIAPGKSASLTVVFTKEATYHGSFGVLSVYAPVAPPTTAAGTGGTQTVVRQPCASPTATTIKVAIFDYGFTFSQSTVPCGPVTFQITNTGAIMHNLDFQIPYANGVVGWSGGLGLLGGESQSETLNYTQTGPYRYQCDVHWIQGQMIGTLNVTQSS